MQGEPGYPMNFPGSLKWVVTHTQDSLCAYKMNINPKALIDYFFIFRLEFHFFQLISA